MLVAQQRDPEQAGHVGIVKTCQLSAAPIDLVSIPCLPVVSLDSCMSIEPIPVHKFERLQQLRDLAEKQASTFAAAVMTGLATCLML